MSCTTLTCRMMIWPLNEAAGKERSLTYGTLGRNNICGLLQVDRECLSSHFSVAVMCRWIAEHNTVPTDAEAAQMEMEINQQVCDAWAEIYVTALREWLDGQ